MLEDIRSLTLEDQIHISQEEKGDATLTSERFSESQSIAEVNLKKPAICHFLRLPTEIRLQIYAYTDIGGHTIEVLNLPIIQTSQGTQCFRTYSTNSIDHELVYRPESKDDEQHRKTSPAQASRKWGYSGPAMCMMPVGRSSASSSSEPMKKRRCFSVHGLFGLTSVCRQIRADTQLLVYELNAFAFTDGNYNYSSAIRAFTQSLTKREIAAIHTIYWPLVNILVYRRSLHGMKLEEPDRSCAEELGALKGLEKAVLRFDGPEFNNIRDKHSEADVAQLKALLARKGGWDYAIEREHRRTLAVRTMKALIAREDVEVQCERSWRAGF